MNLDDLLSQVKIDGTIEAKEFINVFLFSGDNSYLNELRTDFKTKFVEPFSKKIKSIREDDIKKIFDPLGVSDISSNEFKDKLKSYKKKVEDFLNVKLPDENDFKKQPENIIKNTKAVSIIPESIKKPEKPQELSFFENILKNINQKKSDGEQKNIGEEITRVSFHPEGITILKTLLEPIYSALKANTESLDKTIKDLIKNMSAGSGGSGIIGLLMGLIPFVIGFLSDIILVAGKIKDAFVWLWKMPGKITEMVSAFFQELNLEEKLAKFIKNPFTKVLGEVEAEIQGINAAKVAKTSLNVEKTAIESESWVSKIKKGLKLDEIGTWFSNTWSEKIMEPLSKVGESLNKIKVSISEWLNSIVNLFKADGKLSGITNFFKNISTKFGEFLTYVKGFEGPFGRLLGFFKPVVTIFEALGKILTVELLAVIDGAISAVKTLFTVWDDIDLNPIQKFTAVLFSFIGGLVNMIPELTSMISKAGVGAYNLSTGKGWQTDNVVSRILDENINDKGGVGQVFANAYIDVSKKLNAELDEKSNPSDKLKPVEENPQYFTPSGKAPVTPIKMNDGLLESTGVPIKMSLGKQNFETAPDDNILAFKSGGFLDKSLLDLKLIMKDVHSSILNLNKDLNENNGVNSQPINITNNSSTRTASNNKEYLMEDVRDVISNNRLSWWAQSERIRATI